MGGNHRQRQMDESKNLFDDDLYRYELSQLHNSNVDNKMNNNDNLATELENLHTQISIDDNLTLTNTTPVRKKIPSLNQEKPPLITKTKPSKSTSEAEKPNKSLKST